MVQRRQRLRVYSGRKGKDVFVHYRAIRGEGHRSLAEGQQVEYNQVTGDKGLQAEDVVGL